MSSNFRGRNVARTSHQNVIVDPIVRPFLDLLRPLKHPPPPTGRIKWSRVIMEGWVHVVEEVPHMSNNNTHDLISRYRPVHNQAETHQDPRQVRRGEDEQAKKAQSCIGVTPRPDVNEG